MGQMWELTALPSSIYPRTLIRYCLRKQFPPTYLLHALNLTDLTDKPGSPVTGRRIAYINPNGTFTFNAQYQRQRPALLELNGQYLRRVWQFLRFPGQQFRVVGFWDGGRRL